MKNKILASLVLAGIFMSSSLCDPGSEILAAEQQESTNFTNDDLNYETETLKVNVEQKDTGYTKYWVAHVQTFSTEQLKSALCGGTYGNPRKTTSEELASHDGIIGINGSAFSYGSGEPPLARL
mgnify:FL=1